LGALTEALEGQYVLPGPGGDPIRNPKVRTSQIEPINPVLNAPGSLLRCDGLFKPILKTPGSVLLELRCAGPRFNFAFNFNLRRYTKVLPTGKNIHALDPQAIPTSAALASAKVVVDRLIERQRSENNGVYPESIALVLWGTDNIKTYGESLAQVMLIVGVIPMPDALGMAVQVDTIKTRVEYILPFYVSTISIINPTVNPPFRPPVFTAPLVSVLEATV